MIGVALAEATAAMQRVGDLRVASTEHILRLKRVRSSWRDRQVLERA